MLDFIKNNLNEIYQYLGLVLFFMWANYRINRFKTSEQMDEYMEKRAHSKNKGWLTLKDFILG